MLVRRLPQVYRREVEAEDLHRADQRRQTRADQRAAVVLRERGLDRAQVRQEFVRARVGCLPGHRVTQRLRARQRVQRARQPRVDAHQRAPVGLVRAVLVRVRRALRERLHLRRDLHQQRRQRQLRAQLVDFRQVEAQHRLRLPRERHVECGGRHVRIAVAIAADPVAHPEEARDLVARQRLLDLGVHPRDLRQEGRAVVRQRVLDLVGHRELGVAQHPRLPELRDAGAQRRLVAGQVARHREPVALDHQLRDRALRVQQALSLHLGRMRGQHRRDVRMAQRLHDVGRAHVLGRQPIEGQRQRALLQRARARHLLAATDRMPILRDVGQVREVGEGADDRDGLVGGEALEEAAQGLRRGLVLLEAAGHRELADALHQLVGVAAFLLSDRLAEDAAQQPDVADQRVAFGGGRGRRGLRGAAGREGCVHVDVFSRAGAGQLHARIAP